ncbi:potassium transporter Kup [uncultured Limimaricola sp.]|uniref:potassium transporter Kup n=1 Tax=uncultured Limimaricola sp. TaxID=2211667 RepID=UPI0030FA836D
MHAPSPAAQRGHAPSTHSALTLGALGVVVGDIGTSPIYALREGLAAARGEKGIPADEAVIGTVSLLVWLLIGIATLKYVVLMLRADNNGEGGTLSLLALATRAVGRRTQVLMAIGILGTALFFGDAMITPAISVLSAVEGVTLLAPGFEPWVIPAVIAILCVLFWAQRGGTGGISRLFGPVMLVWFMVLGGLGALSVARHPEILAALSPAPGLMLLWHGGGAVVPILGAAFLAVTGAEALYADMGHFGRRPIRLAWTTIALPCLLLSYAGQGALVLTDPEAARDPFFLLAPSWALPGLIGLATIATVIASQAVITGAFSVAYQAMQLGLLPRMAVRHTSETQRGQIYLPRINVMLLVCVIILVLSFGSSSQLAGAYGIAVTGEMLITTLLAYVVMRRVWTWSRAVAAPLTALILVIEAALFGANMTKLLDGGYVPLTVAAVLCAVMAAWRRGSILVQDRSRARGVTMEALVKSLSHSTRLRHVPGSAVFLTAEPVMAPPALLHNIKHNGVLHERTYVVTVAIADQPHLDAEATLVVEPLSDGVTRVRVTFGYMDPPNIARALRRRLRFDIHATSFFLNRRSVLLSDRPGMARWRKKVFIGLTRTASAAHDHYHLPSDRVIELGQQISL